MQLNFTRVIISSTFPDEIHAKLNCNECINAGFCLLERCWWTFAPNTNELNKHRSCQQLFWMSHVKQPKTRKQICVLHSCHQWIYVGEPFPKLLRSKVAPSEQEMLWPRSNMRISASSAALWSAYFCFSHSRFHTKQIKNSVLMITCCSPFLGIKNKSKRKLPKLYTCFHFPQSVWNNQMWTGSFSTSPEDSKCSIELA